MAWVTSCSCFLEGGSDLLVAIPTAKDGASLSLRVCVVLGSTSETTDVEVRNGRLEKILGQKYGKM